MGGRSALQTLERRGGPRPGVQTREWSAQFKVSSSAHQRQPRPNIDDFSLVSTGWTHISTQLEQEACFRRCATYSFSAFRQLDNSCYCSVRFPFFNPFFLAVSGLTLSSLPYHLIHRTSQSPAEAASANNRTSPYTTTLPCRPSFHDVSEVSRALCRSPAGSLGEGRTFEEDDTRCCH